MTGTSARETSRPAKRPRPSATDYSSNVAPPVLFRLPSISPPAHEVDSFGSTASISRAGLAMGTSGPAAAPLATALPSAVHTAATKTAGASITSPALAVKKAAGQRLFNTIVMVLLLIALAIISVLAFRGGPTAKPEFAGNDNQSNDRLKSLGDLRLPDISKDQTAAASASTAGVNLQETDASKTHDAAASGPQLASDKTRSTSPAGLTINAADLAKKTNATPQVQLGTPIPMRSTANSALAASKETASQSSSNLPLTTPRYETVSTPSSSGGAAGGGASSDAGASPSLWDGAKKAVDQKNNVNSELILTGSNDSEMSLIPSDYSSPSAKPTSAQPVSTQGAAPTSSSGQVPSSDSASLGVTVGAGMAEPEFPNARATATPDLDVAAISSKFLEYSRHKSTVAAASGTEVINPHAPAAPATNSSVPATTVSTNAYNAYTAGAYQQNPASAGVPYGTTGATLTPYVRNSPTGAAPSGLGSGPISPSAVNPASASALSPYPTPHQTPAVIPSAAGTYPSLATGTGTGYNAGYNSPTSGGNGFAIPPRGAPAASGQMPVGAPGAATNASPTGAYSYPPAQNYGYASNTAGAATYKPAAVTSNPYPGGQAPQGMIGQSGFATAPSGDVVGGAPMPVTGTLGFGTSATR